MSQRQLVSLTVTIIGIAALAWMIFWFVIHVTEILILLLVSAILAAGLAPSVALLERWRLPRGTQLARGVAIFLLYLGLFVIVGAILSMIVVPAVNETAVFVQRLPDLLVIVQNWLAHLQRQFPWLPGMSTILARLPEQITNLPTYGTTAAGVAFRFVGSIGVVATVLVFTFYMLLEGAQMKRSFLELFPGEERPRVSRVLERIGAKFGGWLRAQLLLSFTVAAVVALGLWILGMPFPALLGVVAGIGELIPMVGPSLGAAVAILVALSQPLWRLVAVVAFYIVVMNVEPHILVPRIMSRVVGMSPLLTLVALLSGIKLLGILGGLLAVPIAAAIQVIATEVVRAIQPPAEDMAAQAEDPPATGSAGRG